MFDNRADLEALRAAEGLPVSRFARLAGIPERTYRRRLARLPRRVSAAWPVAVAEGGTVRADLTQTARGVDAVACLRLAVTEAERVLELDDLRTERGLAVSSIAPMV